VKLRLLLRQRSFQGLDLLRSRHGRLVVALLLDSNCSLQERSVTQGGLECAARRLRVPFHRRLEGCQDPTRAAASVAEVCGRGHFLHHSSKGSAQK
jgi:hypothetical protein